MRIKLITLCILFILCISFTEKPNDSYTIDVGHTYIGFDIERFLVGEVTGRFNDFSANISMNGEDYTTLKMNVTIQVNSIDSNNETRDGHLKGDFWLNATVYPEIKFSSTVVKKDGNGDYTITGDFTIKDVTKTISFPIEILGPFKDPTQKTTIGIKADFSINRFDYNINFNKKMGNGSFFIGDEVKIKIRALATQE